MLEYQITGYSKAGGKKAKAEANRSIVHFDATDGRDEVLPNPAELLLSALAACILKNVERYSNKLHIPYKEAKVTVNGIRSDVPPAMQKICYLLEVDTDVDERKLDLLHRNIMKFGTITNTLRKACDLTGKIQFLKS